MLHSDSKSFLKIKYIPLSFIKIYSIVLYQINALIKMNYNPHKIKQNGFFFRLKFDSRLA